MQSPSSHYSASSFLVLIHGREARGSDDNDSDRTTKASVSDHQQQQEHNEEEENKRDGLLVEDKESSCTRTYDGDSQQVTRSGYLHVPEYDWIQVRETWGHLQLYRHAPRGNRRLGKNAIF